MLVTHKEMNDNKKALSSVENHICFSCEQITARRMVVQKPMLRIVREGQQYMELMRIS